MPQLGVEVEDSKIVNGTSVLTLLVPGFSEKMARRRAKNHATVAKGMENVTIESSERDSSGDIPGRTIFSVRVESPR